MKIVHITHTDIRVDSRILKEIEALSKLPGSKLFGLGFSGDEYPERFSAIEYGEILTLRLFSRALRFLPAIARHFINFFEMNLRVVLACRTIKPDVIHCHDTMVLLSGFVVKKLFDVKLVYDAHELESQKNAQSWFLSKVTLFLERCFWHEIDLFVTVSDSILNWYVTSLGPLPSVVVLNSPNFKQQNTSRHKKTTGTKYLRKKFGIPDSSTVLIYVGILAEGRGLRHCVKACQVNPSEDLHIVFVGYGPLERWISNKAASSYAIHLHEPVPHDELEILISECDFGLCLIENVSLSDYFCLPNKLFEYAFSGVPVIASDFPEIKKLVESYDLGVCVQTDADAIAQAFEYVLQVDLNRTQNSLNDLSWERQASALLECYRKYCI